MLKPLIASLRLRPRLVGAVVAVATTVAALVFAVNAKGSFSAAKVYASNVRIQLERNAEKCCDFHFFQNECEVVRSEVILARVISTLGSNTTRGKWQLGTRAEPGLLARIAQLRKRIEVRPVWAANAIDARIRSEDRKESTQIANALVETYREYQGNSLTNSPPAVSSPLMAQGRDRALPVNRLLEPNNLAEIVRDAVGAVLLGMAAGSGVVLVAFRRRPQIATEVLPWLFMIVFFVVLGASALKSSVNLAVATAAGLLLAFVVAGVVDWFIFLARKHPEGAYVFPAVFLGVLLLVIGVAGFYGMVAPEWYLSTARLRFRLATPEPAGARALPQGHIVYDPQLIRAECEVMRSERILRTVVEHLDLNRQWGKRYYGGKPFRTSDSVTFLNRSVEVSRIPETRLIEIRVFSDKAEEAAAVANDLWETYRDRPKEAVVSSRQESTAIQVEVLDHAFPATSPAHHKWEQLSSYAVVGLVLAFAAGAGALRIVSELAKERNKSVPVN